MGQPAIAMTDHGNLHGMVKFYKEGKKQGIKPIIGCEVYVVRDRTVKDPKNRNYNHLVLLAKNETGLKNLITIVSDSSINGFYHNPRTDYEMLRNHSEGIICLSACQAGEIGEAIIEDNYSMAMEKAILYNDIFEDFYLEIQAGSTERQLKMNEGVVQLSQELGIPLVVTNDSHYIKEEDAEDHEILLAIQVGKTMADENRFKFDSNVYWVKSEEETRRMLMATENITPDVIDQAIANTLEVAEKCNVEITLGEVHYPNFEVPEGETLHSFLKKEAEYGLFHYAMRKDIDLQKYQDRLEYELSVIEDAGLSGYMLIVKDYVEYANKNGIPTGPGRGSAAGALVSFLIGITKIDPLEHNLMFERFYVPGRTSVPDIDLDICKIKRQELLDYVIEKYGAENVSHIGTFGTLGAKMALKDVARALGIPLQISDAITAAVPEAIVDEETDEAIKITIDTALAESEELRQYAKQYPKLFSVARKLEGIARHTSSHAAGIVISPVCLDGIMPLMRNKKEGDSLPITQLDMNDVEDLGFVKMDFLGLESLTTIQEALDLIEEKIDLTEIPLDDPNVYEMICNLDTLGIFQVSTNVGKKMTKDLQPKSFQELTDILAIGRPGPMKSGQDKEYIARKFGYKQISYAHPKLEPILSSTYGVIIYQEQIMQIVRELAGFTHAEADQVRKAVGKKNMDLIRSLGEDFIKGCEKLETLTPDQARSMWESIQRYGEYCFNLSHAASYAIISYWMAWLKYYYPTEFMAATLSTELRGNAKDKDKKVSDTIQECKRMGIKILPPSIRDSNRNFSVENGQIRFGIAGIKGVGPAAVEAIFSAGPYESLEDFMDKVEKRKCNKKVILALIMAGAFDFDCPNRIDLLRRFAEKRKEDYPESVYVDRETTIEIPNEYLVKTKLEWEKIFLGGYISDHPIGELESESLRDKFPGDKIMIAGVVNSIRQVKVKRGRSAGRDMAFASIGTPEGEVRVVIFPDQWDENGHKVEEGKIVRIRGKLEKDSNVIADYITNPRVAEMNSLVEVGESQ